MLRKVRHRKPIQAKKDFLKQKCKQKWKKHLRFLARNPEQVSVLIDAKADLHSHCEPLGADLGVLRFLDISQTFS